MLRILLTVLALAILLMPTSVRATYTPATNKYIEFTARKQKLNRSADAVIECYGENIKSLRDFGATESLGHLVEAVAPNCARQLTDLFVLTEQVYKPTEADIFQEVFLDMLGPVVDIWLKRH